MANNNFYSIKNHTNIGNSYISSHVFEDIANTIITKSKYARICSNRSKQNNKPIRCEIKKDNLIYINADIALKKGKDIKQTCDELIDEIENAILLMGETKAVVNLNVAEIDL